MTSKPSILVVDDELHLRELLKLLLTHKGYAVEAAGDGEAALELLRERRFDLVLSDMRMEPIDGLTLMREAQRLQPGLPVIMMTAYRSPEVIAEATESGAAGYVIKPFDASELLATVAKTLEGSE